VQRPARAERQAAEQCERVRHVPGGRGLAPRNLLEDALERVAALDERAAREREPPAEHRARAAAADAVEGGEVRAGPLRPPAARRPLRQDRPLAVLFPERL